MAIRLMRAADVPKTPRDRLYRASRLHAVVFVLVCLAGCVAMVFYRWPGARVSYYISAVVILLLLALRHLVTARFHPLNWLVRIGDEGLFVHFRSYLNDHLPAEDPTVAFIPFGDIRSARSAREWVTTPDMGNRSQTQIIRSVELELAADAELLESAFSTECGRSAVPEKRWYGTSATLYRDYPVSMESRPFLRMRWQVVPGPSSFLKAIRRRVPIAESVVLHTDFSQLQGLPRATGRPLACSRSAGPDKCGGLHGAAASLARCHRRGKLRASAPRNAVVVLRCVRLNCGGVATQLSARQEHSHG